MNAKISKTFSVKQKSRLEEERIKSLKQIDALKKDDPFEDPDRVSDNAAVDTEVREQDYHQIIEAKINDLQRRIKNIDLALKKITKGTYGTCEKCNKPILVRRLELLPESRYCVECESKLRS